ncbi:DUF4129 domain-containing protein [Aureimonas sp. ME7]|uniref:DUF4129 domain-containing protein n=1 Tax=Aureimonas sp. ME7 TaxID=2744252 RepID=UPI0015F63B35|nr:DUF4129 domain-containing protein [Aureimonas sp. ME7]
MRLALVLISSFCLLAGAFGGTALARIGEPGRVEPLVPPRGTSAQAYDRAVAGDALQRDILYLPPDAALDVDVAPERTEEPWDAGGGSSFAMNATAWAFLGAFGIGMAFLAVRYRRFLAELFAGGDRAFGPQPAGPEPGMQARGIDGDLLARLRAESDPRVGLRLLLKRFLALAAEENEIVLRRSLTTRELMRSLPGSWRHRADLEQLAGRVELTVFGGREMSPKSYQECLDLAAPLLFRVKGA